MNEHPVNGRLAGKVPSYRFWVPPPPPLELDTPLVMPDRAMLLRAVSALRRL